MQIKHGCIVYKMQPIFETVGQTKGQTTLGGHSRTWVSKLPLVLWPWL